MSIHLKDIASKFRVEGEVVQVDPLGPGFINDTYVVRTDKGVRYILQKKNHNIFPDIPGMMNNIMMLTEHMKPKVLAAGGDPSKEVLTVVRRDEDTMDERDREMPYSDLYHMDRDGNFWTVCVFIEGSVTYDHADTTELAYKGGKGIGRFQTLLSDFDKPLSETIKGFHNTRWRFTQWDEALRKDAAGRVKELAEEISWVESRREKMLGFWKLVENGSIPLHVTHNDTKISNILFDENREPLCVIDLDTCMNNTSLNDFGDAIRSYANTGFEDDNDLSRVSMSIDMFKAYAEGYLSERKDTLCDTELEWLAFSALYMTFEQMLRFLMDYIDGDIYYKTGYPGHNLVRTRAQYRLLCSMEEQYEEMKQIIRDLI